jgi:integrase/recombinase XerD
MAEVDKVEKLKFTDNTRHIEQVRDMFLFGCYTGMRYSDVMELTNEDIKEDKDGYFVETRMNKTQNFIKIPLALLFKRQSS